MARYQAGETLASIARTYGCSPPAISYVVSRSRARQIAAPPAANPAGGSEPYLVKAEAAAPGRTSGSGTAPSGDPAAGAAPAAVPNGAGEHPPQLSVMRPREAVSRPPSHPNGEPRRTLHLSLGNGGVHGNGAAHPAEASAERHDGAGQMPRLHPAAAPSVAPPPQLVPEAPQRDREPAAPGFTEPRAADFAPPRRREAEEAPQRNGASFIDRELRARVDGDIAAFLAAFDAALAGDTQESRSALREATDRLLRAGARTRIELERLEARLPLPHRDGAGHGEAASRYR